MAHITSLERAIMGMENIDKLFQDEIELLRSHRLNYTEKGPQNLVILRWEWPAIHWDKNRTGASMKLLDAPIPGLVPNNSLQNEEELQTQIWFIDELKELGVLEGEPKNDLTKHMSPLYITQAQATWTIPLHSRHEKWGTE